jgi:hypothetical protein
MPATYLRSFSDFDEANAARAALLAASPEALSVELLVVESEAGPAQGNFLVGNGRYPALGSAAGGAVQQAPYEFNFDRVVHRGEYLLIIHTSSPAEQVDQVLRPFDCVTP